MVSSLWEPKALHTQGWSGKRPNSLELSWPAEGGNATKTLDEAGGSNKPGPGSAARRINFTELSRGTQYYSCRGIYVTEKAISGIR